MASGAASLRRAAERAAGDQAAGRLRRELGSAARRVAGPVLSALATGADPQDAEIRAAARLAESALRSLAAIPGSLPDDAVESLTDGVLAAHAAGVEVDPAVGEDVAIPEASLGGVVAPLRAFLAACAPGTPARVTLLRAGRTLHVVAIGTPVPSDADDGVEAVHRAVNGADLTWTLSHVGPQLLLESALDIREPARAP